MLWLVSQPLPGCQARFLMLHNYLNIIKCAALAQWKTKYVYCISERSTALTKHFSPDTTVFSHQETLSSPSGIGLGPLPGIRLWGPKGTAGSVIGRTHSKSLMNSWTACHDSWFKAGFCSWNCFWTPINVNLRGNAHDHAVQYPIAAHCPYLCSNYVWKPRGWVWRRLGWWWRFECHAEQGLHEVDCRQL